MIKAASLLLTASAAIASSWDYSQNGNNWEDVMCHSGSAQSPVPIPDTRFFPRLPIFWRGAASYQNNHVAEVASKENFLTIQYNAGEDYYRFNGSYMFGTPAVNETYLAIGEIEIHTPSQHTYKDKHYDVEMTILHKSIVSNKTARVSVLFDRLNGGEEAHPFIEALNFQKKGEQINDAFTQLNLKDLFAQATDSMELMYYKGSIPYPPCTENVDWFIYHEPMSISHQ